MEPPGFQATKERSVRVPLAGLLRRMERAGFQRTNAGAFGHPIGRLVRSLDHVVFQIAWTGPMIEARFGHVNLVARDWRVLAGWYERVLGCTPVPPERDYRGPALAAGTGVPDAALRGVHLRLPGHGPDGPTLEVYEYEPALSGLPPAANRQGFGHIAFAVADVGAARDAVLVAGGAPVGELVTTQTSDGRRVTWAYVTDPEGNIVELQAWSS